MTPKAKAKELVDKFSPLAKNWDCYNDEPLDENNAKQCALIAVQEIIKSKQLNYLFTKEQISCMEGTSDDRWIYETFHKYWKKVKQEIQKL